MLDLIPFLMALVATLVVLAAPVLAVLAIVKVRRLERELRRLERALKASPPPSREQRAGTVEAPTAQPKLSAAASTPPPPSRSTSESAERTSAPVSHSPTPPPASPPKLPAQKRERIQWEQWIGIRGAAVLGGLLFALAGILFFKHAFDRGWITPSMRVALGATIGLSALGASEVLRRRDYRFAPPATAGAGVVILYSTTWASHVLYEFLSALAALPLMALLTGLCAWISVRFRSQFVAILGLVGGFAAPVLLSIPADHPIGLFGYLLLLDLGLLALGLRMRWPALGLLGMVGTFLIELVWTTSSLDRSVFPLALASLGTFGLLFAAAGQRSAGKGRRTWVISQAGALLLPFAFATYFASLADLGSSLWPLAILMACLAIAAGWIAARQDAKWLVSGAAAGSLAVSATWYARAQGGEFSAWDFALSSVGLSALFFLSEAFFGRSREGKGLHRWAAPLAPVVVSVGFGLLTVVAVLGRFTPSPSPWLVASLGQAVLLHFLGRGEKTGALRLIGGALAGVAMGIWLEMLQARETSMPASLPYQDELTLVWAVPASALLFWLAWWSTRRDGEAQARWASSAASVFPLLLASFQVSDHWRSAHPGLVMGTSVTLALLAILPTVLRAPSRWFAAALLVFVWDRADWTARFLRDPQNGSIAGDLFLLELAALVVLAGLPLFARKTLGASRLAWAAAASSLFVALGNANRLLDAHFAVDRPALAPLALALLAAALFAQSRFSLKPGALARESADRWLLGVGAVLVSISLAEFGAHHEKLLVYPFAAVSLAALWRWRPTFGLKVLCVALSAMSAIGVLVLSGESASGQRHAFESADVLLWNWTSYATGVPALCALGAALLIGTREAAHTTNLEQRRPLRGRSWASALIALAATLLVFVWVNLQVLIYFEPGPSLRLSHDYGPACDLTLSICWIGYALLLLAIGMARGVAGLRQASLAFLLLTLFKVFLHDLGDLQGLYRVGSLLGLGVSLIFVSLLYQRFVFPRRSGAGEAVEGRVL